MKNRAQKIRLGIFIVITLTILIVIVGLFTTRQLFKKRDVYYVSYHNVSVSGLEVGSPVKYMGIEVGAITDIKIDPKDVSNIIVELALKPGTPIKKDAQADIVSIGITGLKTIEIRGGSNEADFLEETQYIEAGSSIADEITGKAEIIAQKAEKVFNNLQEFTRPENLNKITRLAEDATNMVNNANQVLVKIDTVIEDNRYALNRTIKDAETASSRLDTSSLILKEAIVRINALVQSDTLKQILSNARDVSLKLKESDLKQLIEDLANVADQTNQLLRNIDNDLDKSSQDFSESLNLLKLTLENLNEASRKINENPSVLIRGTKQQNIPDEHLNQ